MNEIAIRKLDIADITTLSLLAKKTFFDAFAGTCTAADMQVFLELYYNHTTLQKQIVEENIDYYFAEINNNPIAYISFGEETPNFIETNNDKAFELKRLYVLNEYHGYGVAQKLIQLFLDNAIKGNYKYAFLGVWEYNYKAQSFYTKYDFLKTNYRHDFPIGDTKQTDIYLLKNMF